MPSVVISPAMNITSPQAPKLFRRIFEDYLIIQSVLHVLTLRQLGAWHIKKEEGRNDFVRRTNNEQEQEQIGHL